MASLSLQGSSDKEADRLDGRESSDGESSGNDDSSDEFFDALEPTTGTMIRFAAKILESPKERPDLSKMSISEIETEDSNETFAPKPELLDGKDERVEVEGLMDDEFGTESFSMLKKKSAEDQKKKLEAMRRRLEADPEECDETGPEETSPSDSQTSSVEGAYGVTSKTYHPFKVIDHDNISMKSGLSGARMARMAIGNSNLGGSGTLVPSSSGPGPTTINSTAVISSSSVGSVASALPSSSQKEIYTSSDILHDSKGTKGIITPNPVPKSPRSVSAQYTTTEPDLVTSCLSSDSKSANPNGKDEECSPEFVPPKPIAPPRKKKKGIFKSSKSKSVDSYNDLSSERALTSSYSDMLSDASASTSCSKDSTPDSLIYSQANSFRSMGPLGDSSSSITNFTSRSYSTAQSPPSPTVSIRSAARDMDKALSTSSNQCVVKALDEEKSKARSSGPKTLKRTESLPKDVISAFDAYGTYRGSGSRSNSGSKESTLSNYVGSSSIPRNLTSNGSKQEVTVSSIIASMAALEEQGEFKIESLTAQCGQVVRTRSNSGRILSDKEILEQVTVTNLDTAERIPLSLVEEKIPACINPLSLHIMKLTSEYLGNNDEKDSDEESLDSKLSSTASTEDSESIGKVRKKTAQIKRFVGSTFKRTVDKAKSSLVHHKKKEELDISANDDSGAMSGEPLVKVRAAHSHKGPYDFDNTQQVQELNGLHKGPVWCMKFSNCGKLLATAGQDKTIRIWVLKDHLHYFQDMRSKHGNVEKISPTPSQESVVSQTSHHSAEELIQAAETSDPKSPFVPRPLCTYSTHTSDVLDIAWSKSFFLLSSSMDRTVRLWHISRGECLCIFQHIDFVTAIAFHPRDDRYFLSGSLDGKLRLWNIPDKKVALWNEVERSPNNLITSANFCQNGKFAVVGTYDGRCIFYHTEQLKYHTQINNRKKRLIGRKITGIEAMTAEDKIVVTSNDSRIRIYNLQDLSLTCKYKGFSCSSSQIKATISHDNKYIVCGSENQYVYIWRVNHDYSKFSSTRRDRNGFWEAIKAHNAVVTCAIFAPNPDMIVKQIEAREKEVAIQCGSKLDMTKSPSLSNKSATAASVSPLGYILVSADFSGCIKIFLSKVKPKHSSLPASALV